MRQYTYTTAKKKKNNKKIIKFKREDGSKSCVWLKKKIETCSK